MLAPIPTEACKTVPSPNPNIANASFPVRTQNCGGVPAQVKLRLDIVASAVPSNPHRMKEAVETQRRAKTEKQQTTCVMFIALAPKYYRPIYTVA